tara:strand:+ start:161 stop:1165 length:1005 start_codon:yes stop_codon:yes gene_type:complete
MASEIKVNTIKDLGGNTVLTSNGSGTISGLPASAISSGTVATARLGSGTASSSTFLAGDSSYKTVSGTTINNNANNKVITGSGTANTLEGEANLNFDGTNLSIGTTTSAKKILVYEGSSGESAMEFQNTGTGVGAGNGIYVGLDANENGKIYNQEANGYLDLGTANTSRLRIQENGAVTMPYQPCFIVKAASQTNVTGNGTSYNVAFTSEIKDIGSNFSGTTFTAPITGSYILTGHVDFQGGNNNITNTFLHFETSNRDFPVYTIKGGAGGGTGTQAGILYGTGDGQGMGLGGSCIADMDANDTVYLRLTVQGAGSDQCDITANNTIFTGCLLA